MSLRLVPFAVALAAAAPPSQEAADPTPAAEPPAPTSRVALVGGTVHDFAPGSEPRVATVVIEGATIQVVAPEAELAPGTVRFDATGLHVVPGLIDGLASIDPDHDALYVSHGVTTVCDPGGDVALLEVMRDPAIRDAVPGPTILTAGAVFDGDPPASAVAAVIQDPVTVGPLVGTLVERLGVDFLNAQRGLGEAGLAALCEAGRTHGLGVWSQGVGGVSFERAVELGQRGFLGLDALLPDGVEWSYVLPTAFRRRIALAAERGVGFLPMLGVQARVLRPAEADPRLELLSPEYAALWEAEMRARASAQADPEFGATALRVIAKTGALAVELEQAGVPLVPGSSAPLGGAFPGASLIDELEAWVAEGFTRSQALYAATARAAQVFGLDDRGAVAPGRVADLVVLDVDPRASLGGFRDPAAVVVRGRLLDRLTLGDMVETVRVAQARVREEQATPIEIEPPAVADTGALVMSGQVETRSMGSRLSSEAWTAFRMPDGSLHLRGRMVVPDQGRLGGALMEIEQILVDGQLFAFALQVRQGQDTLTVEGRYEASRFMFRRLQNGQPLDTRTATERPALINLAALADSVTTAFVVSQRAQDGPIPVLSFGDGFEPVLTRWKLETGAGRERILRTHQGGMLIRFGPDGGLEEWVRIAGRSRTSTVPIRFSAWGGAGLPPAFEPGPAAEGDGGPVPLTEAGTEGAGSLARPAVGGVPAGEAAGETPEPVDGQAPPAPAEEPEPPLEPAGSGAPAGGGG